MWRLNRHLTVNRITNYGNRTFEVVAPNFQGGVALCLGTRNVIAVASLREIGH